MSASENCQPQMDIDLEVEDSDTVSRHQASSNQETRRQEQCILRTVITNSQRSSSTSQESVSTDSRSPALFPSLTKVFTRLGWSKTRSVRLQCDFCGAKITTNDRGRWVRHALKCKELAIKDKDLRQEIQLDWQRESLRLSTEMKDFDSQANLTMTKMLIANRAAMRMVESHWFKKWVDLLNPGHKLASRKEISERYVRAISSEAYRDFLDKMKRAADYELSIEFDHWTDNVRKSYLAVVATASDASKFLISLTDVSKDGHKSDVTVAVLTDLLKDVPPRKLNSIISDSASACKSAREKIVSSDAKLGHIIEHRCIAHFINLIGQRYCHIDGTLIEEANDLTKILNRDIQLLCCLREVGARRVPQSSDTRWYSKVNMLEGLLESRAAILEHIDMESYRMQKKDRLETVQLLHEEDFWNRVHASVSALRPLANCIAIAEASHCSLGEATRALLHYARGLFQTGQEPTSIKGINAFLGYFNELKLGSFEMGLLLACYSLDRRNKMDFLTDEGSTFILSILMKIARLCSFTDADISALLIPEFEMFCRQKGVLSSLPDNDESAKSWWSRQPDGKLKTIALRLANLRASSANTERFLSLAKNFQGDNRTNYSTETLTDLVRSNVFLQPEKKTYEDPVAGGSDAESCMSQMTTQDSAEVHVYPILPSPFSDDDVTDENKRSYARFMELIDFSIVHELVGANETQIAAGISDEAMLTGFKTRLSADKRRRTQ